MRSALAIASVAAAVLPAAVSARPGSNIFQRGFRWGGSSEDDSSSEGGFGGSGSFPSGAGGFGGDSQASATDDAATSAAAQATTASANVAQAQATGGYAYTAAAATATATGSSSSSNKGSSSSGSSGSSGSGSGTALSSLAGGSGVGGTTCTVTELSQVTASVESCSNILLSGVTVPASSTLSVTVPSGGALLFAGTMTVEYTPDSSHTPIVIAGSNAKVAGLAGAVIDGQGAQYWDGEGSNGGSEKPSKFFKISDMESSSIEQLTIQNWPTHLFSVSGSDVTISNLILDNSAGDEENSDGDALGHNTDAFDVSSVDGLYVHDITVYNQGKLQINHLLLNMKNQGSPFVGKLFTNYLLDDCVAVNQGSNMVFENMCVIYMLIQL